MHEQKHIVAKIINPSDTFFIGDFHFDHTNIIKYCNRPFKTAEEMNSVMLNNYNNTVNEASLIFFLGDMAFGRGSKKPREWLAKLKGNIIYVKGSHDNGIRPTSTGLNALQVCDSCEFNFERTNFILTHDPDKYLEINAINQTYPDWIIHAHTHNHYQVNLNKDMICVSVEAINYTPISLVDILKIIKEDK